MADDKTKFIHELEEMGLQVERGASGHHKIYLPDGRYVMDFAHSSGDRHWQKSAKRRLRYRLGQLYDTAGR